MIGPDLCCDWLISLICNHYRGPRQLQQREGGAGGGVLRKIGGEQRHQRRAVLSPRCSDCTAGDQEAATTTGEGGRGGSSKALPLVLYLIKFMDIVFEVHIHLYSLRYSIGKTLRLHLKNTNLVSSNTFIIVVAVY